MIDLKMSPYHAMSHRCQPDPTGPRPRPSAPRLVLPQSHPKALSYKRAIGCVTSHGSADHIKPELAPSASSEAGTLFVIHKPKKGCPDGWTPITSAFLEADGSSIDACAHGTGAQGSAVDYIIPGEAFIDLAALWSLGPPKERL